MKTKKLLAALLTLLIFLSPTFAAAETVVTSFYPIYLFALNLTQGIDGITIRNLAAPNTGCLHDYQLSTGDMKVLNKADVFLINGAGMESYLTRVMDTFPKLPVVDASAGITLLTEDGMDEYVTTMTMTTRTKTQTTTGITTRAKRTPISGLMRRTPSRWWTIWQTGLSAPCRSTKRRLSKTARIMCRA